MSVGKFMMLAHRALTRPGSLGQFAAVFSASGFSLQVPATSVLQRHGDVPAV